MEVNLPYTVNPVKGKSLSTFTPTAGEFYNPGYEHLKSIYILKDTQARSPLQVSSVYILPLMALQKARLAIEEYVNLSGRKVDWLWDEIDCHMLPIQERIAHIYKKVGEDLQFKKGIWKDVLGLFNADSIIQGDLAEMKKLEYDDIPEKFKRVATEYPIYRSQAIAEEAIDLLLDLSDLNKKAR